LPTYNINNALKNNFDVFISVSSPSKHKIIYKQLNDAGFSKIYNFIETIEMFPEIVSESLTEQEKNYPMWYRSDSISLPSDNDFYKLKNLLSDKKSQTILENIKSFRQESIFCNYVYPDYNSTQYFPEDIDLFDGIDNLSFIDCGAYDGNTILDAVSFFSKKDKNIESIVAFEPSQTNQKKILDVVNQLKEKVNITVFPCPVYSENKIISFNDSDGMVGSISDNCKSLSSIKTMSVSIDDTVFGISPNYIKMDIEGSEKEAIVGAINTIKTFKPVLAISLYHRPNHLWEIPFLLENIYDGKCRMYLRHYGEMGLETVLYCVSDKNEK